MWKWNASATSAMPISIRKLSANGKTVREAQARAYEAIARIDWPGGFCRKDIGWRAIAREAGKPAS